MQTTTIPISEWQGRQSHCAAYTELQCPHCDDSCDNCVCLVLKLARQPYYRWLACPVTRAELTEAYRANALFDAHTDDPEFGYRFLVDEARDAGEPMSERTAWRICSDMGWCSAFAKPKKGKSTKPALRL